MGFLAIAIEHDVLGNAVPGDWVQADAMIQAHHQESEGLEGLTGKVAERNIIRGYDNPRNEVGHLQLFVHKHEEGSEKEWNGEENEEYQLYSPVAANPPSLGGGPDAGIHPIDAHFTAKYM
jgi:hypothetical protein